jgi:hypothetical protein
MAYRMTPGMVLKTNLRGMRGIQKSQDQPRARMKNNQAREAGG